MGSFCQIPSPHPPGDQGRSFPSGPGGPIRPKSPFRASPGPRSAREGPSGRRDRFRPTPGLFTPRCQRASIRRASGPAMFPLPEPRLAPGLVPTPLRGLAGAAGDPGQGALSDSPASAIARSIASSWATSAFRTRKLAISHRARSPRSGTTGVSPSATHATSCPASTPDGTPGPARSRPAHPPPPGEFPRHPPLDRLPPRPNRPFPHSLRASR